MDIQLAKKDIIKRFQEISDESLILAIQNLLDYAQKNKSDLLLGESISRGLEQSHKRQVKPHDEVMKRIRKKYTP